MKLTPASIPENVLSKMDPKDRAKLGVMSLTEANEKQIIRDEKDLQSRIVNLIRLRGWEYVNPPMHVRSRMPKGYPDFTIFCPNGKTIFFECKVENKKLEPEQIEWEVKLKALGFDHYVVRDVATAKSILDSIL